MSHTSGLLILNDMYRFEALHYVIFYIFYIIYSYAYICAYVCVCVCAHIKPVNIMYI
jgi:hypothetical protein